MVFTSSLAVYGKAFDVGPFGPVCVGDNEVVVPCSCYGSQKLMAGAKGRCVKGRIAIACASVTAVVAMAPQRARGVAGTWT